MREYLTELRENWTDSYWRADHPEVTYAVALAAFVLMCSVQTGFRLLELTVARRMR